MVFYLSWAANAVLFVAACFLAADTANAVFASWLTEERVAAATGPPLPARTRAPRWLDRQVIVDRNLFNSATVEGVGIEPAIDEDLEASKLPLQLLGTTAADDPTYAWAAIQDRETRETLVVTIGDILKEKAEVLRIERRRIVVSEDGEPRELAFGDDEGPASPVARAARPRARRLPRPSARARTPQASAAVRKLAENRFAMQRKEIEKAIQDPTDILSQARFLPKYDGDQMLGFQVNSIKKDSVLREFGLRDGDLITEFNGIEINSPTETARLLQEFNEASSVNIIYQDAEGNEKSVDVDLNE